MVVAVPEVEGRRRCALRGRGKPQYSRVQAAMLSLKLA